MARKHFEFQFLLYSKFILNKEHDAQATARKMGTPNSTFYHYLEAEATFPVDLVGQLYNATGDPAFLNFVLQDTDMMLAPRQSAEAKKTVLEEALDVAAASGDVVREVHSDLSDGTLTDLDRRRIIRLIEKNQKELEDLRLRVAR